MLRLLSLGNILLSVLVNNLQFIMCDQVDVIFTFKEYPYKDSPKNEMTFREFETACEQSAACNQLSGLTRTRCVRECVSPSCYKELYSLDPLEEGEIDVRLNSFKGCFVQRSGRTRN